MSRGDILQEGVEIPGLEHLTYGEISERYTLTPHAEVHANSTPRFAQAFPYNHSQILEDLEPDVHPIGHMEHTHSLTVDFLDNQVDNPFSIDSSAHIRIAALLHDIGECTDPSIGLEIVGDVSFTKKVATDETKEATMREYFFDNFFGDFSTETLERIEAIIKGKVDSPNREPRAFAVIERIGYYLTAIRAGKVALQLHKPEAEVPIDDIRRNQLTRLAVEVTGRHRPVLQQASEEFDGAGIILETNVEIDSEIQERLEPLVN